MFLSHAQQKHLAHSVTLHAVWSHGPMRPYFLFLAISQELPVWFSRNLAETFLRTCCFAEKGDGWPWQTFQGHIGQTPYFLVLAILQELPAGFQHNLLFGLIQGFKKENKVGSVTPLGRVGFCQTWNFFGQIFQVKTFFQSPAENIFSRMW